MVTTNFFEKNVKFSKPKSQKWTCPIFNFENSKSLKIHKTFCMTEKYKYRLSLQLLNTYHTFFLVKKILFAIYT